MSVRSDLAAFIVDEIAVGRQAAITPDEDLLAGGLLDSLGVTQLVAFLEDRYGIHVADEDLTPANFQSIASVEAFVARRGAKARTW